MWSKIDPKEEEARERQLASKEKFFKPAANRRARILRHDGSQASAYAILRHLVGQEPSTLLVKDEMVNQEKDLAHTTAGADLMRELRGKGVGHTEALEELCVGIEAARFAEDEETKEILQDETRKARERVEKIRGDLERMVANLATENLRLENENRRWISEDSRQMLSIKHSFSRRNVGLVSSRKKGEDSLKQS